jgi:tetratricopeptide (TPR) repeat protein
VAAEHPAGRKLVLQTWFGQAGAHLADGDEAQAVVCYDQATAVAQQDRNPILAIEAQRMAGYCRWRQGDVDGALVCYGRALAMGAQLRAEVRGMTTLPLAAVDMLRAVDSERTASVEAVKLRLDRQLEQDRREAGEQAAAAGATISEASALQIESQLDESLARSRQTAEDELQQLVADASGTFAACFANSRRLLASDWPLVGTAAFPGLSRGPGLAAADGSTV